MNNKLKFALPLNNRAAPVPTPLVENDDLIVTLHITCLRTVSRVQCVVMKINKHIEIVE